MKFTSFQEQRFRNSVAKAMTQVQSILDNTRHPRLAEDEDHTYADKFALAEFVTNTAVAAQMNALQRLGLDDEKLQTVLNWVHTDHKTVTLRLEASHSCSFSEERDVDVVTSGAEVEVTTVSGTESTTKVNVITKFKEYHWNVEVTYRLLIFPGTDASAAVELQSRLTSTIIVTSGGQASTISQPQKPPTPRFLESMQQPPIDVNVTWFFQQIEPTKKHSQFQIDRVSVNAQKTCKTPRRNEDVDAAFYFYRLLCKWTLQVKQYLTDWVEGKISGSHNPVHRIPITRPSLSSVTTESLFCPVLPLMENSSVFADVGYLLTEQCRSLDEAKDGLDKRFPPRLSPQLVSVAEANLLLIAEHLLKLCTSYQDGVDYIENMLKKQMVQAIGKEIQTKDFDQFMVFHNPKIFGPEFAPMPFTYSVRRPNCYPDGTFTIECTRQRNEPIHTLVRRIPRESAPSMFMPITAASSIELAGEQFLHGWMVHRFYSEPDNMYELIARARQFSSFMVVIGTLQGPSKFDPLDAIILQNKDEVLIPLLTTALPSAKDFKDSIASLSPEQQAFAQSFRSMQLESSVFGLCIIQLKPQLEKLLGLPVGALTKEIQLTQDLMSLFIEYQIPSDMLTFDGPIDSDTATKVSAVKGFVRSIFDVIDSAKEKQLINEERKADMRAEMSMNFGEPQKLGWSPDQEAPLFRMSSRAARSTRSSASSVATNKAAYMTAPFSFGSSTVGSAPAPSCGVGSSAMGNTSWSRSSVPTAEVRSRESTVSNTMSYGAEPSTPRYADSPKVRERPLPETSGGTGSSSSPPPALEGEDFTNIPKLLDAKLEKFDIDGALRSLIIKVGSTWNLNRKENLLVDAKKQSLKGSDIESEKTKAFDLLDAISRSGALPIDSSELHVVIAVSHCFDNDVMGSIIQDNVNPIEKVEKSSLLIASTIFGKSPMSLLKDEQDVQRLTNAFPELDSEQTMGE